MKEEKRNDKQYRLIREIIETIILTILMFVVINLAIQNYDVDGPSMEPSLHNQERIVVDKVSYHFRSPSRGDVIVFVAPPDPALDYVKRIIALPGDTLTIKGTTVIVDNAVLKETYVADGYQGNPYQPIINQRVPANDYFVMGDDRKNSSDSRDWGFVPRQNIIGRATLVYWPLGLSNSGFLPDVSSVFADVHTKATKANISAAPVPLKGSTFDTDGMVLFAMPGFFLVCSRCRKQS
ncbi:signal peptidase I [Dictyobacter arantiisoli]|uniref:signal peptidase I n=1 Tax=Dictyobacter arantiisoli TaxID=2014874 RepID=UPI0011EEE6F6|nr:signal peptidase I [Dictyobacter arantiisoli]